MSRIVWTVNLIEMTAKKYSTRWDFQRNDKKAYDAARYRNILDEVCSHMEWAGNIEWTHGEIKKEALKYVKRNDFKRKSSGAYQAARLRGILDEVCLHMSNRGRSINEILKIAKKYKTIGDFRAENEGLYSQAHRRGWMPILRSVLVNNKSGFDPTKPAILYYLSVNDGQAYKIGITNRTIAERYTNKDLEKIEILKIVQYASGHDARVEETRIIRQFSYAKYKGDDLLSSGNSELFYVDILSYH